MIDVRSITDLGRLAVHRWHRQSEPDNLYEGLLSLVCAQHQFKMYNDPSLNPRIYGAVRKAG